MNNSEKFLIVTIVNKNRKCRIQLNEMENIEKIKEICKPKLGFENIDINKINLCFIDDDKEKNIINEFNDLIEFSNINSEKGNLSIELIAEISKERENIMDKQNKNNNLNYINNNNKNSDKIIDDNKDRMINALNDEIEKLIMKCKKYKYIIKNLIEKYEKKICDLKNVDSRKEIRELTNKNNNNINDKTQNENNNNLNLNDINKNEKKVLNTKDINFINIECNKCKKKII